MKIADIRWKQNYRHKGVEAETAYKSLEKIREKGGGELEAGAVVEAAKPARHTLHRLFEWDNSKAAHQYRLEQARALMRSIEVVYEEHQDTPYRAYEVTYKSAPSRDDRPTAWTTTEEILKNPQARDRLIAQAIREAMAWRRKFQSLRELENLFHAVDEMADELATETPRG